MRTPYIVYTTTFYGKKLLLEYAYGEADLSEKIKKAQSWYESRILRNLIAFTEEEISAFKIAKENISYCKKEEWIEEEIDEDAQ